ncbi:MAG: hypothetical protein C0445_07680 [Polaromonas sp.]|nr:hypothetical protein [Polaromonas sp.]
MAEHLNGQRLTPPTLDTSSCHLGQWWHKHGRTRAGDQPGQARLEAMHEDIHHHARTLVALKAQGDTEHALAGVSTLCAMRNGLTAHLLALLDEGR